MKITKSKLRQLIKEELNAVLEEGLLDNEWVDAARTGAAIGGVPGAMAGLGAHGIKKVFGGDDEPTVAKAEKPRPRICKKDRCGRRACIERGTMHKIIKTLSDLDKQRGVLRRFFRKDNPKFGDPCEMKGGRSVDPRQVGAAMTSADAPETRDIRDTGAGPDPTCKGSQRLYKGKCRYPDEINKLQYGSKPKRKRKRRRRDLSQILKGD